MIFLALTDTSPHISYITKKSPKFQSDILLDSQYTRLTLKMQLYQNIVDTTKFEILYRGKFFKFFPILYYIETHLTDDEFKKLFRITFINNLFTLFFTNSKFNSFVQKLNVITEDNIDDVSSQVEKIFYDVQDPGIEYIDTNLIKQYNLFNSYVDVESLLIDTKVNCDIAVQYIRDNEVLSPEVTINSVTIDTTDVSDEFHPRVFYKYFKDNFSHYVKSVIKSFLREYDKTNENLEQIDSITSIIDFTITSDVNNFKEFLTSGNIYKVIDNIDDVYASIKFAVENLEQQGITFRADSSKIANASLQMLYRHLVDFINLASDVYTLDSLINTHDYLKEVLEHLLKVTLVDTMLNNVTQHLTELNSVNFSSILEKCALAFFANLQPTYFNRVKGTFGGLIEEKWSMKSLEQILFKNLIPLQSKSPLINLDLTRAFEQFLLYIDNNNILKYGKYISDSEIQIDFVNKEFTISNTYSEFAKRSKEFLESIGFYYAQKLKQYSPLSNSVILVPIPRKLLSEHPKLLQKFSAIRYSNIFSRLFYEHRQLYNLLSDNIDPIGYQQELVQIQYTDLVYFINPYSQITTFTADSIYTDSRIPVSEFMQIADIAKYVYEYNAQYLAPVDLFSKFSYMQDYLVYMKGFELLDTLDTTGRNLQDLFITLHVYMIFKYLLDKDFKKVSELILSEDPLSIEQILYRTFKGSLFDKLVAYIEGL